MLQTKITAAEAKKLGDDVAEAKEPFVATVASEAAKAFRARYPKLRHDALVNGGRATLQLSIVCDFNAATRSVAIVHQPAILVPEAQHMSAAVVVEAKTRIPNDH